MDSTKEEFEQRSGGYCAKRAGRPLPIGYELHFIPEHEPMTNPEGYPLYHSAHPPVCYCRWCGCLYTPVK